MTDSTCPSQDLEWDRFVATHPHGHVLQTSRWARLKTAFCWRAHRIAMRSGGAADGGIKAGSSLLLRSLPWGQTLIYAPKGPLIDWSAPDQLEEFVGQVRIFARPHHAALLKIEPEILVSGSAPEEQERADLVAGTLSRFGFRRSPQRVQPLSTIHIDITPDEEQILARMKPKWRYNIRLAERKGVAVRPGSAADLPSIHRLLETTGRRDGFGVHSLDYYALAAELFEPTDLATWLLAEAEGQLLAAIAVFALGRMAWYMWGASSDEGRNLMPNHALQWAAIRWAKARGCKMYDLWGIPDEIGADPSRFEDPEAWGTGGLWGVYRFKQGFCGDVVQYAGAWDLPLSPAGYALYRLALQVRLRVRKAPEAA